jgi:hypothetical protein
MVAPVLARAMLEEICVKRAPSTESNLGAPIKALPVIVIDAHTPARQVRARGRRPEVVPRSDPGTSRRKPSALDAPVVLPIGTKWIPFLIVLAVLLVPIAIVIVLFLASRRPVPVVPPRGSRVDLVTPSAREVSAPTAATTVPVPLKHPTDATANEAVPAKKKVRSTSAKPKEPVPTEIRSRAAPAGVIKNRRNEHSE